VKRCILLVVLCEYISDAQTYECCFFTLDAGLLARNQYSESPATSTHVFLVSLCLKANAEMVPNIPSCHYMLLI